MLFPISNVSVDCVSILGFEKMVVIAGYVDKSRRLRPKPAQNNQRKISKMIGGWMMFKNLIVLQSTCDDVETCRMLTTCSQNIFFQIPFALPMSHVFQRFLLLLQACL